VAQNPDRKKPPFPLAATAAALAAGAAIGIAVKTSYDSLQTPPVHQAGQPAEVTNSIGLRLKRIEAGRFLMGSLMLIGKRQYLKSHSIKLPLLGRFCWAYIP
jgi:hypothetical protein